MAPEDNQLRGANPRNPWPRITRITRIGLTAAPILLQDEIHGYRGYDLNRLTIEKRRFGTPSAHRVDGRLHQRWMAGDHLDLEDSYIPADNGFHNYGSLGACGFGLRRINGPHLPQQHRLLDVAALPDSADAAVLDHGWS
jgi:hypothetical protein